MIDLHCHILPGVDDGSPDMGVSLEMARDAWKNGIRAIVATPHCSRDYPAQNLLSRKLVDSFVELNRAIRQEGIQLQVYPGMEVMVNEHFPVLLQQKRLIPLAGSKYLLIEFEFDCTPQKVSETIALVKASGYIPLIAHPERYFCVQWNPALAVEWQKSGAVLQLNRGSLQGKLSRQAQDCAWELLKSDAAAVIASDAHGSKLRRAELTSILHEIAEVFSWAYAAELLIENPARILRNEPVIAARSGTALPR